MSKQFDLKSLSPQKVDFEDILTFAELALEDPEVVSILKKQISSPPQLDAEAEHLEMLLLSKADDYVKSKGLSWKLRSGYKEGFAISAAILKGDIEHGSDPKAKDILKFSRLIEFGDDK
ncbi:MAG: hypothetical protein ABJ360_26030 [Roseobacter sp.]|uniref:hypothetical protein n=1 Tax=Roseibium sp. TaxID=1936156 RepID=UPI00326603FC